MKSFFEILAKDFNELANLGFSIDENVFSNPALSIVNSRLFAEKLLENVIYKEEQDYLIELSQYERISRLSSEGILEDEIVRALDDIRRIGNKAVHEGTNNDIEYSIRLHKKLYIITKWFFEAYGTDFSIKVPMYQPPSFNKDDKSLALNDIDDIIKKRLEEFVDLNNKKILAEEKGIEKEISLTKEELEVKEAAMKVLGYDYTENIMKEDKAEIDDSILLENKGEKEFIYTYKKLKGSYLFNEISKLCTSSQEAVESCESLSVYKQYLHVERSIQNELINLVTEASNSSKSQLLLICGSVGDGKSHLLAYLSENYADMMSNFNIHNDATESFDPKMTEIETLANVLNNFNDANIDTSNEKLILAINLGVLNNFLEDDLAKQNYTKLKKFVEDSGVFNQNDITDEYQDDNFKLVSFGNYNIYEVTSDGVKSDYIERLLRKIGTKSENNIFYNAYQKDLSEKINSPIIMNYSLLLEDGVINKITNLIIMAMVKQKKIIGTRELLNFIYELLVPANIDEFDMGSSATDYIKYLLPNTLFNTLDRGMLLNIVSKEDVLGIRNESIDEILIKLNMSPSLSLVLKEYIDEDRVSALSLILNDIDSLTNLNATDKQDLIDTILRMLYLVGNLEIQKVFEDNVFNEYMNYLYNFNIGNPKGYKNLVVEVKDAIFNWNGSLLKMKNCIYLNEGLEHFKVAEILELKISKVGMCPKKSNNILERFKTNINVGFEVKGKSESIVLELDYELYKKIRSINNGYYASRNDREEAVIFVEFIEKLLVLGSMEEELLIEDRRDKNIFRITCEEGFGEEEFKFERIEK